MRNLPIITLCCVALAACQSTGSYEPVSTEIPKLSISFVDKKWDGKTVPSEDTCTRYGSKSPMTPALIVKGIPSGANALILEFNDESFAPLSYDGGHGKIGFWINEAGTATVKSVPGETMKLGEGVFVEAPHRTTFTGGAYLPPCSGGRSNTYSVDVKAVYKAKSKEEKNKLFAEGYIKIGQY